MKKSCRCEPLWQLHSRMTFSMLVSWSLWFRCPSKHCQIACRCLSGKPWLGAFGWSIIVMCFLLDPDRHWCFFLRFQCYLLFQDFFSNRTPLDQVLLNCLFGLVAWVFLITLIFWSKKNTTTLINLKNHQSDIREMFRHYQWTLWTLESIKSNNGLCHHSLHSDSLTASFQWTPWNAYLISPCSGIDLTRQVITEKSLLKKMFPSTYLLMEGHGTPSCPSWPQRRCRTCRGQG